jgi:hypothetical protein
VVLGGGLREPDITTVSAEVAGLEGGGDILLDDDGTTGGVDEPRSWGWGLASAGREGVWGRRRHTRLHLGDQVLVEQTAGLLVERAVDGDDITLGQHLLEGVDSAAANLLLNLRLKRLVVEVEELLAVEGLETAEDTLTDTADSDGTDDLALKVELVLGGSGNVPVTSLDLLVGRDEVADQDEDGHEDVLSDGDDVGASDLSDGDTAVGLVGSVQVDVVRSDTSGDGDLELLGLGKTLSGEVTGVETRGVLEVVEWRGAERKGAGGEHTGW